MEVVLEEPVRRSILQIVKDFFKKIKCKFVCCSHSSCSYNEDREN